MKNLLAVLLAVALLAAFTPAQAAWQVITQQILPGSGHPESVAYDAQNQALYMSNFGDAFKPTLKDGKGYISKLDLQGKQLETHFLPGPGDKLNKPKGLWVADGHLWAADIDSVWCFDLKTKKGRRLALPQAQFANDVTVNQGKLYVSDTNAGCVYLVQPANFLKTEPKVRVMLSPTGFHPNGLWPAQGGGVYIVAKKDLEGPGGLYQARDVGQMSKLKGDLGRLDGVAMLPDGSFLYTDWAGGGLFLLSGGGGPVKLAGGFKGPADFAVVPRGKGFLVVVPDLVTGELHLIQIANK
jgi:outer membrane protein assembly factor BamB